MARLPILLLLLAAASASAQPAKGGGLRMMGVTAEQLEATTPASPNPFTAFLAPGVTPDFEYWTTKTAFDGLRRARTRALRGLRSTTSGTYRERERAVFNRNDRFGDAEPIPRELFGSAATEPVVEITGVLEAPVLNSARVTVSGEDAATGAIAPFAIAVTPGRGTLAAARIGDGPFGATTGDVDVYDITIPQAGTYVEIAARTPVGDLDPVMALFDPFGAWVYTADDSEGSYDPVEARVFETAGTYRLYVWGYNTDGLTDRANAGTGSGAGSTGPYELSVSSAAPDVDAYAVELEAGDVLAVATSAPVEDVALYGPGGELRMRSQTDISGLYADEGPLLSPAEVGAFIGGITAATIAPVAGTYIVAVQGEGAYSMVVQSARPGHERAGGQAVQTVYVEFGGGTYHPGRELDGTRETTTLSPLRAFLPRWGLTAADEDAVIDATLAMLGRTLRDDLRSVPGMSGLDLRILNDRDHPDPGPTANRLVIAGTSEEIGADGFLGQASSVDVGNFRQNDVAYIVLGQMSDPAGEAGSSSLNQFTVAPGRTKAELVGLGVGTVAAHEAGHFFGLHHTENENDVQNVQDAGGNDLAPRFFIGADRVFGPGNGLGVRFRDDDLFRSHAFSGVQRSPEALAYGLFSTAGGGGASAGPAAGTDALLRQEGFSAAARAAATAQPRTGRVSLDDAFASDANGWAWSHAPTGSAVSVRNGTLAVTAGTGQTLRIPFKNTGGTAGRDFAVRMDFRHAGGCEVNGAGVFARRSDGPHTAVLVDTGGEAWSIIDQYTGSGWAPIEPWEKAPGLASDVWNTIEVVVLGTQATLLADGRIVRQATIPVGADASGMGATGILVRACAGDNAAGMSYDVDNLTVVALDPPGIASGGLRSFPGGASAPTPATAAETGSSSGD